MDSGSDHIRERITALFKKKFTTDLPLDSGEELTRFAREMSVSLSGAAA